MIQVKGTAKEIAKVIHSIAPTYPVHILLGLSPTEWHFIRDGIDVRMDIEGEDNENEG